MVTSSNWSERVNENWQTKKAYAAYTADPNICEVCGSCIWPWPKKLGIVNAKQKTCCSLACASVKGARRMGRQVGRPKNEKGLYRKTCECGELMTWNAKKCRACRFEQERELFRDKTIQEWLDSRNGDWASLRAGIASMARKVIDWAGNKKPCLVCGYDKRVDACHIKAIKDFPRTAKISEVNNSENLISLCPNHHWEFDHGFLSLVEIEKASIVVTEA